MGFKLDGLTKLRDVKTADNKGIYKYIVYTFIQPHILI